LRKKTEVGAGAGVEDDVGDVCGDGVGGRVAGAVEEDGEDVVVQERAEGGGADDVDEDVAREHAERVLAGEGVAQGDEGAGVDEVVRERVAGAGELEHGVEGAGGDGGVGVRGEGDGDVEGAGVDGGVEAVVGREEAAERVEDEDEDLLVVRVRGEADEGRERRAHDGERGAELAGAELAEEVDLRLRTSERYEREVS